VRREGDRICVILNPAAGRGRGARMIPEISTRFAEVGVGAIRITKAKGHERAIASEAIANGCSTIVAVGGDGTTANVANAILQVGSEARLAAMPAGTGNDFAKVLGTDKSDAREVAALCAESSDVRVDAGKVEDVFFLNSCGFGFDVAVVEGIARTRWLPGRSVYVYTALRQLFQYRGVELAIGSGPATRPREVHLLLVIANAANFGGAFTIAPEASVTDGQLDAVSILNAGPLRRVALLAAAMKGVHGRYPECRMERAREFEVAFPEPPAYETDGELHRAKDATVRICCSPLALRVVASPGARARLTRD